MTAADTIAAMQPLARPSLIAIRREADGYGRLPLLVALLGGAPTDIALGLLSACIPQQCLALWATDELQLQVCGSPSIPIDELKKQTRFTGRSVQAPMLFFAAGITDKALGSVLPKSRPCSGRRWSSFLMRSALSS